MANRSEIEIIDYELMRMAKNIVVIDNPKVKRTHFRMMKGIATEFSISPAPYLMAARRDKLTKDTLRQNEAKTMARRPSSIRRRAERKVELMNQRLMEKQGYNSRDYWLFRLADESRDYREKLLRG